MFSLELRSEIVIDSSAEQLWKIITDFESYPRWNPFIRQIQGPLKVGERLEVFIQPSGSRGTTFKPKLLVVTPSHELRWLGRLYLPWLFDGEHALIIEETSDNMVKFVQKEKFSGLLVPFAKGLLNGTLRGFEEMNMALKRRAEL